MLRLWAFYGNKTRIKMDRIYFITHQNEKYSYIDSAKLALDNGIKLIQLRMKHSSLSQRREAANILKKECEKYKAKLNKQLDSTETSVDESSTTQAEANNTLNVISSPTSSTVTDTKQIEELTNGSIIEKPIEKEQVSYNDSLDFLDENIKYSKYVIYIDPENTDFIESLTVKERKNLINKILREQDDIALTKKRYNSVNTFIKHTIIGVITTALAIPLLYFVINSSLEASINNYRRSKTIFQTLYKEKGKIKTNSYKY